MSSFVVSEENQYLQLIQTILDRGSDETTRNGEVRSIFGYFMRFSLSDASMNRSSQNEDSSHNLVSSANEIGILPLITTKNTAWKACFKELMWFISGCTDNSVLKNQNVHIWDANGSREFLDSRGLVNYPEDILGPIYGFQWRNFNGDYDICNCKAFSNCNCNNLESKPERIDQLQQIIDALKDPSQRSSRRLIMTAWNPCQLDQMALPPCHILAQFNVRDGKYLSCSLYQRSGDVGLGVPFNIASYSFLTHILAKHCGLVAEDFVYCLGNAHIYKDHIEPLQEQLKREPYEFPKVRITTVKERIEDYTIDDIEWIAPYVHHPTIKMKMVA